MIIKSGFVGHRKVRDLRLILQEPLAEAYLVRIWDRAQQERRWEWGVSEAARELGLWAEYAGPPERLYNALRRAGWLDDEGGRVRLHDWEEHQGQFLQRLAAGAKGARRRKELAAAARAERGQRTGGVPDDRTVCRTGKRTGGENDPSGLPDGLPSGYADGEPVLGIRVSPSEITPPTPPVDRGDGVCGEDGGMVSARKAAMVALGCLRRSGTWGVNQGGAYVVALLERLAVERGPDRLVEEAVWYEGHHGDEFVPQLRTVGHLGKWSGIRDRMERERGAGDGGPVYRDAEVGEDVRIGERAAEILGEVGR